MTEYAKHSVNSDALDTLGEIIGPDETRDAIHLAVYPVEAGNRMFPADHVILGDDGLAYRRPTGLGVGIVDPFLTQPVDPGEWFWLVVYPRQITSLHHVWSHPAFDTAAEAERPHREPTNGLGVERDSALNMRNDHSASWSEELYLTTPTRDEAERWLRDWASRNNELGFEETISLALAGPDWEGGGITVHGIEAHATIPPEFWDHLEVYTGRTIPKSGRAEYFSCSC